VTVNVACIDIDVTNLLGNTGDRGLMGVTGVIGIRGATGNNISLINHWLCGGAAVLSTISLFDAVGGCEILPVVNFKNPKTIDWRY